MGDKIVNTSHIVTAEVEVKPFYKDPRSILNTTAATVSSIATIALAMQGSMTGVAWFAPATALVSGLAGVLDYFSKRGVVSKNKRVEFLEDPKEVKAPN